MHDKINILEHELADIEHLEISLLPELDEKSAVSTPQQVIRQINAHAADMKRRLLKRINALKSLQPQT